MSSEKHGVLEGIMVIEWCMALAGPTAGALLAEMGAEVITIERPGAVRYAGREPLGGDATRAQLEAARRRRMRGLDQYEYVTRNKKSVTIDMTKDKGIEVAHRLVAKSDVFHTSLRRDALKQHRMDYETLSGLNPKLVYSVVSGLGPEGPLRDQRTSDFITQGYSSIMYTLGEAEAPLPQAPFLGVVDHMTGTMSAHAIVAALFARERQGKGQEIVTSILGTALWMIWGQVYAFLTTGKELGRHSRTGPGNPIRNYYQCGDGKWVIVGDVPGYWRRFARAFGLEEMLSDPRFADTVSLLQNHEEAAAILDRHFATKPREEWLRMAREADLIFGPVNTISEVMNDEQVAANEYVITVKDPELGEVRYPGYCTRFSETPVRVRRLPPLVGENTEEVLRKVAGYSDSEIKELEAEEVTALPSP